jgi:hypothetical protein
MRLSLKEQVEELRQSGVLPLLLSSWDGRLEEWLVAVLPAGAAEHYGDDGLEEAWEVDGPRDDETVQEWTDRRRDGVHSWPFPTDVLRSEYLASVVSRPEADVLALLRLFLFEDSCFGFDSDLLYEALYVQRDPVQARLPAEYWRRLDWWPSQTTPGDPVDARSPAGLATTSD